MSQSPIQLESYYPDTRRLVKFGADGPQPQHLWDDGQFQVILAGLEPGQQIPAHPESRAMYHFLEGTGVMILDDEELAVEPGTTVITPAGARRGMRATTRLVFVAAKSG